jgi:hypothetical protein
MADTKRAQGSRNAGALSGYVLTVLRAWVEVQVLSLILEDPSIFDALGELQIQCNMSPRASLVCVTDELVPRHSMGDEQLACVVGGFVI